MISAQIFDDALEAAYNDAATRLPAPEMELLKTLGKFHRRYFGSERTEYDDALDELHVRLLAMHRLLERGIE